MAWFKDIPKMCNKKFHDAHEVPNTFGTWFGGSKLYLNKIIKKI
jgi:hypothetical protein